MYVCICNAITERQIVEAYCEGACSMRALREKLGVADCCGRCAPCARDVLRRCKAEHSNPTATSAADSSGWLMPPSAAGEPA